LERGFRATSSNPAHRRGPLCKSGIAVFKVGAALVSARGGNKIEFSETSVSLSFRVVEVVDTNVV
jgi:hypothetical protein